MTPQERQLVDQLFERLATLENAPRDTQAIEAIRQGLARAPNALYALVQTVLVHEEALKRAGERISELESRIGAPPTAPQADQGFLGNMRESLLGRDGGRGSVPSVQRDAEGAQASGAPGGHRPMGLPPGLAAGRAAPGGPAAGAQPGAAAGGGGFLGTAGAAAAGALGGTFLMNTLQNLFGGDKGQAQTAQNDAAKTQSAQEPAAADDERFQLAHHDDDEGYDDYDDGDFDGGFDSDFA